MRLPFEKLLITIAISLLAITSCLSCITGYKRIVVQAERAVAPPEKVWPSVAKLKSTPGIRASDEAWYATGWAIDKDHLITAGHFCDNIGDLILLGKAGFDIQVTGSDKQGLDIELGLASVGAYEKSDTTDICILYMKDHKLTPLKVSDDLSNLETEDHVYTVGAPGTGFPIKREGTIWAISKQILIAMHIQGGASGSPLLKDGVVIGMIVSSFVNIDDAGAAERSDNILKFVHDHLGPE